MNNATRLLRVQEIIHKASEEGERLKRAAPSRSTGLRRQFKHSHDALKAVQRLLQERA